MTWREYPQAPDALLVKSALGGDKAAFTMLVRRHMNMARSVTLRLLRDHTLVADVLQEATIAALIGLPRLRSPERFGSWYAGIALNVARRLIPEVASGPLCGDVVDGDATPDEQIEAAEVAQRVRDAVRELPFGRARGGTRLLLAGPQSCGSSMGTWDPTWRSEGASSSSTREPHPHTLRSHGADRGGSSVPDRE